MRTMRPFLIFVATLAITGMLVAAVSVAMLPLGLPGTMEYILMALIIFPMTGVAWHRHLRRSSLAI